LLALLGAHHILHVGRIRVKEHTSLLMDNNPTKQSDYMIAAK
jgi:hypothetical protein